MKHTILLAAATLCCCGSAMAQDVDPNAVGEHGDYAVINISEAHYATYYNSQKAYKMPEGCCGILYFIEQYDDGCSWESNEAYAAGSDVPAGQALVIYSPNVGTKTLTFIDKCSMPYNNQTNLCGTDDESTITEVSPFSTDHYYYYALSYDSDETRNLGFYWRVEGGAPFVNGAHRAYLRAEKAMVEAMSTTVATKVRGFSFESLIAADIESRFASDAAIGKAPDEIYDLTGRKLYHIPASGIYIINGKKFKVR